METLNSDRFGGVVIVVGVGWRCFYINLIGRFGSLHGHKNVIVLKVWSDRSFGALEVCQFLSNFPDRSGDQRQRFAAKYSSLLGNSSNKRNSVE